MRATDSDPLHVHAMRAVQRAFAVRDRDIRQFGCVTEFGDFSRFLGLRKVSCCCSL